MIVYGFWRLEGQAAFAFLYVFHKIVQELYKLIRVILSLQRLTIHVERHVSGMSVDARLVKNRVVEVTKKGEAHTVGRRS